MKAKIYSVSHKAGALALLPLALALLLFGSCDDKLDITPKDKTILNKISEVDEILNNTNDLGDVGNLCLVVNECYTSTAVPTVLTQTNTLNYALLTYDESIDRANLTPTDDIYSKGYSIIYEANTVLAKADNTIDGDSATRAKVKAEAHILRAYVHFLLVNIYAAQYDAATAADTPGIAYVTDIDPTDGNTHKATVKEVYDDILADLDDSYINTQPDNANVLRGDKAWGNAVKAKVLMQMKEYEKALPYALKSLQYNDTIEDRTPIIESQEWTLDEKSPSNVMYMGAGMTYPWGEYLSTETVSKFEDGDIILNYAQSWGDPLWDDYYGQKLSGVKGSRECSSYDLHWNAWGVTSDRMYYVAAECYIRTGEIQKGMDLINKVRRYRIDPDKYADFTASTEKEAMALLQRAKFIECLATYENFFDRKRWNTEEAYKATLTRDMTLLESGERKTYSIAPDSKLWIFPFPANATRNNPELTQNY